MELRKDFAARLRVLVADSGLSKAELARRAGIKPSAIYPIINGKRRPNIKELGGLAHELCVDLLDFIGVSEVIDERDALARQLERTRQRASRLEEEVATQTRAQEETEASHAEQLSALESENAAQQARQARAHETEIAAQRSTWETRLTDQERQARARIADLERQLAAQTHRAQRAAPDREEFEQARAETRAATAKIAELEQQLNAEIVSAQRWKLECEGLRRELQRWTLLGGLAAGQRGTSAFEDTGQLTPELETARLVGGLSSAAGLASYGIYRWFHRKP